MRIIRNVSANDSQLIETMTCLPSSGTTRHPRMLWPSNGAARLQRLAAAHKALTRSVAAPATVSGECRIRNVTGKPVPLIGPRHLPWRALSH